MIKLFLPLLFVVGCAVDTAIEPVTVEAPAEIRASETAALDEQFCAEEATAIGTSDLRMIGCWCDGIFRCCSFSDPLFGGVWVSCVNGAAWGCQDAVECPPGGWCD